MAKERDNWYNMERLKNVLDRYCLDSQDIVTHDAGWQFMARIFRTGAELPHIETKAVPVESAN